ncbi:hypothetical protein [Candidatus Burkholderia verschuerenii]|uniref:hypothetical protein n=1 Tax=Candidatus Burkholderia verschuerenii TaxID=242163 RepID=UPI00067AAAAE|nr:hypothetical protein [Candidatus Burkholderia verschuerenii]
MRELVAALRTRADWKSRPEAFTGAQLLAEADAAAAAAAELTAFLFALPGPRAPWMKAAIEEKAWFKEGD